MWAASFGLTAVVATAILATASEIDTTDDDDAAGLLQIVVNSTAHLDSRADLSAEMRYGTGLSSETYAHSSAEAAGGAAADRGTWQTRKMAPPAERPCLLNNGRPLQQAMVNSGDAQYTTIFTLGGQKLSGLLDTGSFELVTFGTSCATCGRAAGFDAKKSPTLVQGMLTSSQTYGSGTTQSVEAFDLVNFGAEKAVNQTFWHVMSASMPLLVNAPFQAIIGVGPPETPAADAWSFAKQDVSEVSHYFEEGKKAPAATIAQAKQTVEVAMEVSKRTTMMDSMGVRTFSICIGAMTGSDGLFTWNDDVHKTNMDMFVQVPIVGSHTWSVQLNSVSLSYKGKRRVPVGADSAAVECQDGCSAILDSGTSLLAVPRSVYARLAAAAEKVHGDCSNLEDLPDLVFEMNGHSFSLPPDAYMAEVVGTFPVDLQHLIFARRQPARRCKLMVMEIGSRTQYGAMWLLGVPFFRKYYTVFDVGRTKQDRSLFIATSGNNCTVGNGTNVAKRGAPTVRRIEAAKFYMPQRVRRAVNKGFMHV